MWVERMPRYCFQEFLKLGDSLTFQSHNLQSLMMAIVTITIGLWQVSLSVVYRDRRMVAPVPRRRCRRLDSINLIFYRSARHAHFFVYVVKDRCKGFYSCVIIVHALKQLWVNMLSVCLLRQYKSTSSNNDNWSDVGHYNVENMFGHEATCFKF